MKVKFLETYTVKASDGRTFVSGEVYDLDEASAKHFLNKNRCEVYVEPPPVPAQEPATAEPIQEQDEAVQEEFQPKRNKRYSYRKEAE